MNPANHAVSWGRGANQKCFIESDEFYREHLCLAKSVNEWRCFEPLPFYRHFFNPLFAFDSSDIHVEI